MAGSVTIESGALPVSIGSGFRLQSGLSKERRQETIRVKREQVSAVGFDGVSKRTVQQTHRIQRGELYRGCPLRTVSSAGWDRQAKGEDRQRGGQ